MIKLVKALVRKVLLLIVLALLVLGGIWYVKRDLFGGSLQSNYGLVVKRLTKQRQLLVADATVETQAEKVFNADWTKDWPDWLAGLTDLLVSRKAQLRIPVKTEFKLELANIRQEDLVITNQEIRFKRPLIIYVDSQKIGEMTVENASTGLVDKVVDVVTGSQKALEFLEERSQELLDETSQSLLMDEIQREKVARFAQEALQEVLALDSDQPLKVVLTPSDLVFQNKDRQE